MIALPAYLGTLVILLVTIDPQPSYRCVAPAACMPVARPSAHCGKQLLHHAATDRQINMIDDPATVSMP
jgi:hypothetical protein